METAGQPHVLCIGRNSVDIGLAVDLGMLRADSKQRTGPASISVGGQCINAAVTLAGLGARVSYAGIIGDDEGGSMVKSFLADRNVDHSLSAVVPGTPSARAYVLVDAGTGERTIVESAPDDYPVLGDIMLPADSDYVYFDGYECPASLHVAALAREAGLPTLMDMEVLTPDTLSLLQAVDTAIVPQHVAAEIAASHEIRPMLKALAALGPKRVAVTMGENGAMALEAEGAEFHVPPAPCVAVDTTGAGDAFHAGFLYADSRGASFSRALEFAASVAGLKCQTPGPSADPAELSALGAGLAA